MFTLHTRVILYKTNSYKWLTSNYVPNYLTYAYIIVLHIERSRIKKCINSIETFCILQNIQYNI